MPILPKIGQTIRAPGKLVLAGEYAVLDGGKSIVMAINRGVQCSILPGSGISTPNADLSFVQPQLKEHQSQAHYHFTNWNPVRDIPSTSKPGFGGSAAACVCACLAAGIDVEEAFTLHHQIQGSGSGIDVAASIYGGTILFEQGKVTPCNISQTPMVIWSGNSAKTGPRVLRYKNWSQRTAFVTRSNQLVGEFSDNPVEVTRELYRELKSMSQMAKIDYLTDKIKYIVDLVEKYGGGAKPSGAGGGDCLIAYFPSLTEQTQFQNHCKQENISIIPTTLSNGVHVVNEVT